MRFIFTHGIADTVSAEKIRDLVSSPVLLPPQYLHTFRSKASEDTILAKDQKVPWNSGAIGAHLGNFRQVRGRKPKQGRRHLGTSRGRYLSHPPELRAQAARLW